MKETQEMKAIRLANQAINNPSLVENMEEDAFLKFVIGIAHYNTELSMKVLQIRHDL